jgi:hypothetical protein
MIVTVATVRMMEVTVYEIVRVSGMRHALMSTRRPVHVSCLVTAAVVIGRTLRAVHVRDLNRVFVDVIAVNVVQMAIVKKILVAIVRHRRVTASGSVRVRMPLVFLTLSHDATPFRFSREE